MGDIQFNGTPEEWDALVKKNKKQETLEEPKQERERGITITHVGKQETLEEVAERLVNRPYGNVVSKSSFIEGAKWQQQNSYSEEDFKLFARQYYREIRLNKSNLLWDDLADKCLEQFKKKEL